MPLYQLLNITGLALDILGAYLLFRWTAKPYERIQISVPRKSWRGKLNMEPEKFTEKVVNTFNKMIDRVNAANSKRYRNSKGALIILMIGFLLQFISSLASPQQLPNSSPNQPGTNNTYQDSDTVPKINLDTVPPKGVNYWQW